MKKRAKQKPTKNALLMARKIAKKYRDAYAIAKARAIADMEDYDMTDERNEAAAIRKIERLPWEK